MEVEVVFGSLCPVLSLAMSAGKDSMEAAWYGALVLVSRRSGRKVIHFMM